MQSRHQQTGSGAPLGRELEIKLLEPIELIIDLINDLIIGLIIDLLMVLIVDLIIDTLLILRVFDH